MIIRRARPGDETDIVAMIYELAVFEEAPDQCTVTEKQLTAALFGQDAVATCHLAEVGGEVAAMALWFRNFSTWDGVAGIHLEDLFVRNRFRRGGLARALTGDPGPRMRAARLQPAELGGTGLERRRDRVLRGRRRPADVGMGYLSGLRPGAVGPSGIRPASQPLNRGRTEQQHQHG